MSSDGAGAVVVAVADDDRDGVRVDFRPHLSCPRVPAVQ